MPCVVDQNRGTLLTFDYSCMKLVLEVIEKAYMSVILMFKNIFVHILFFLLQLSKDFSFS